MDAVGAYAYDEVYLVPCTKADGVFFLTAQTAEVRGAGCADILKKTVALNGAEMVYAAYVSDELNYKLFLASYGSHDGSNELFDVEVLNQTPLAAVSVPRGGYLRAYIWQWQNLASLHDAAELR